MASPTLRVGSVGIVAASVRVAAIISIPIVAARIIIGVVIAKAEPEA